MLEPPGGKVPIHLTDQGAQNVELRRVATLRDQACGDGFDAFEQREHIEVDSRVTGATVAPTCGIFAMSPSDWSSCSASRTGMMLTSSRPARGRR